MEPEPLRSELQPESNSKLSYQQPSQEIYLKLQTIENVLRTIENVAIYAVCNGHLDILQNVLLSQNGDTKLLHQIGPKFLGALHLAAYENNYGMTELLLNSGIKLWLETPKGDTALNIASRCGNVKIVQLLLEKSRSDSSLGPNLVKALDAAHQGCHTDVISLLLEAISKDLLSFDFSAVFLEAATRGSDEVLSVLLKHTIYKTPLWFVELFLAAARAGQEALVQTLLRGQPGLVNWKVGPSEETALHLAAYRAAGESVSAVRTLLKNGSEIEKKDINGKTPLFIAVERGNVKVAEELLEGGADIECTDSDGTPLLFIAVTEGTDSSRSSTASYARIVELLVRNGADVNEKYLNGDTLLHTAYYRYHLFDTAGLSVIKALIDSGANVNARNSLGEVPRYTFAQSFQIPESERD